MQVVGGTVSSVRTTAYFALSKHFLLTKICTFLGRIPETWLHEQNKHYMVYILTYNVLKLNSVQDFSAGNVFMEFIIFLTSPRM